jgi:hypothetical protein
MVFDEPRRFISTMMPCVRLGKMKRGTKRIIIGIAAILVVAAVTIAWGFFSALRTFGIEDRIHGAFFPASIAIERFAETNGVPPKTLDDLVPTFLDHIPTSPFVDKIEYRVVGGTNWIMNAHSTALKPARVYSWRSDRNLTQQEKEKLLKEIHNVAVFKE